MEHGAPTMMDKKEEERMHAESDLRTLIEAEKVKRDKGRHAAAMKMAQEQKAALVKIQEK